MTRPLCCGVATILAALLLPAWSFAQPNSERQGLIPEPQLLASGISWIEDFGSDDNGEAKDGFYPEFGQMITGAGWISAGAGYRRHLFDKRALFDASAAVSWRTYTIAQARVELPALAGERLTAGASVRWQDYTQVRYFGLGSASSREAVSDYRVQAIDTVGYATFRAGRQMTIAGTLGWLNRPHLSSSTGTFDPGYPNTLDVFAADPGAAGLRQPHYLHADLSVSSDTRDHPGYPSEGGLYRMAWATYRDRGDGSLSFDRVEAEAAHFVPIVKNRSVLAIRAWGVISDTSRGGMVPFYFMPSLGGGNTLRAYRDYRFHDRHLLVANVESRWALMDHVDLALFFDAGNVAARVDDLNFDRTSYGVGFRVHTSRSTLGRVDIARGREGWRIVFKTSDPLRIGRVSRRTAALPFVP